MPDCRDEHIGLPTLPAVLDKENLRRCLLGLGLDGHAPQVRILKVHPGSRCTLEIRILIGGAWRTLIGKVYAADRSDVYRAMQAIANCGFGPQQELSIPQPIAFVPQLNLLLLEMVEGPVARDWFLSADETDRAAAAIRCARWLGRFHREAPATGCLLKVSDLVRSMEKWASSLAALGTPVRHQALRLFERLATPAVGPVAVPLCAGHASYSPAQVILANGRTVVFDWDGHDVADPARDVARFLVALRRLAFARLGSIRALDSAAVSFRHTYAVAGPALTAANLRFYEAAACLQLAKYCLIHPVSGWYAKMRALLEEGLRVLEG